MMRITVAVAAGLTFGLAATAAQAATPPWMPYKLKNDAALAAERAKREKVAEFMAVGKAAEEKMMGMLQRLAVHESFVGNADGALAAFDEFEALANRPARGHADDLNRLATSKADDAINAIVAEARKHQIVILNEAHHVPMHRAFAMRLARELRKIGYTWLACETFHEEPMIKGYVSDKTGYYTQEPVFANFIRDAVASGWKLAPYEHIVDDDDQSYEQRIENRESGQARNLAERIFAKEPKAKVFIFVGYSHLTEMPDVGHGIGTAWMAAQLKHRTGIDPLTVDQTDMMAHTRKASEHRMYAKLLEHGKLSEPFVLRSPKGGYEVFGGYRFAADMQVVHPRYSKDPLTGRPQWLQALAGFAPREVPSALMPAEGKRLVAARIAGQPDDAIPADVVTLEAGKPAPRFMLPPGEYTYSIID